MYQIGDYVVQRNYGVAKITAIEKVAGMSGECYRVEPLYTPSVKVGVPVNSAASLRSPLTKAEATELLENCGTIRHEWTSRFPKEKPQEYKKMLLSMEPKEWICLMRESTHASGKASFGVAAYFKKAEELLCGELGFVLGQSSEEMKHKVFEVFSKS